MIDEIAVARPLDFPEPGQAAVQRIPEPVEEISCHRQPQPAATQAAQRVAGENDDRGGQRQAGQLVGRHPAGETRANPGEQPPLLDREHILLDPHERSGRGQREFLDGGEQGPWRKKTVISNHDAPNGSLAPPVDWRLGLRPAGARGGATPVMACGFLRHPGLDPGSMNTAVGKPGTLSSWMLNRVQHDV
jgi:hypothetical protein